MTALLVDDPALALLAALDRLPMGEPLPPEEEAELARREADVHAGMPMRGHALVANALEQRRADRGG